jgi:hypothetical protein
MVDELIDENLGQWNEEKVKANFVPFDVHAICAIPIGRFSEDDWAWSLEKRGNFIVRSAYQAMVSEELVNGNPSSSGETSNMCWKKLWKLPVPPKVRAFWWRVINGFVPCRHNLKLRHMEQISHCKLCGAAKEMTFHALFECSWARTFWYEIKQPRQ